MFVKAGQEKEHLVNIIVEVRRSLAILSYVKMKNKTAT